MSIADQTDTALDATFADRHNRTMPSVDDPWDSFKEVFRRMKVRKGDRSTHRAYHSLYEDMMN